MSKNIHANVKTPFTPEVVFPEIDDSAFVHPLAAVIGAVHIGKSVMVSPGASVRGDEGGPIWVGDESNVQDGVVVHALAVLEEGQTVEKNMVEVEGKKWAVYVGNRVTLAHQTQIHGPAFVGDESFVGMQTLVFNAKVGRGCFIEPKCLIFGVEIGDDRYVPAGSFIKKQADADALPVVTDDREFRKLKMGVVDVNIQLAAGYNAVEEL